MASTTRSYVNEERTSGAFVVRAYSIISTDIVVLDVYEPAQGFDSHGTTTSRSDGSCRLGSVRTRRPASYILALPLGERRTMGVTHHYLASAELCEEIIRKTFPEIARAGDFHDGRATISLRDFRTLVQS